MRRSLIPPSLGLFLASALVAALLAAPATAFSRAEPQPLWQANERVAAIVEVNGVAYLGGRFTALHDGAGSSVARSKLGAIDLTTGEATSWAPAVNANGEINSIAASPDGATIYVGGKFTQVGTTTLKNFAAIDASTGAVQTGWPGVSAVVFGIAATADHVYIGGNFKTIDKQERLRIAAFDVATRALSTWDPGGTDKSVKAVELTSDGGVALGGPFSTVGSANRPFVAVVDQDDANVRPWADPPRNNALALSADGDHLYVGSRSNHVTKHLLSTGQRLWSVGGDGDVQGVEAQNGVVYAGGHFQEFAGAPAQKIVALSSFGTRLPWDAWANSSAGVFAVAGGTHIHIGGDFTKVTGQDRRGYAAFLDDQEPPSNDVLPFSNGFDDGFASWSGSNGMTLDTSTFGASPPSARVYNTTAGKGHAFKDLALPEPDLCLRTKVNLVSNPQSVVLLRVFRPDGAGIARIYADADRKLRLRSDVTGTTFGTGTVLPTGWHELEMCVSGVGAPGSELTGSLDGTSLGVRDVDLGDVGVGRFQIGDDGKKVVTINFDDVTADRTA